MQTATALAEKPAPAVRAPYVQHSRTVQHADRRTHQLADAMLRLYAECGEATEAALIREGFSRAELAHHGEAAHVLAEQKRIRHDEAPPPPTDDELLATALGAVDMPGAERIARQCYAAGLSHEQLTRIWPKLAVKLAARTAATSVPPAPGARQ
jgi:hypothetical protein